MRGRIYRIYGISRMRGLVVRECFFFFVARGLSLAMLSRIYKIKQDFLDFLDFLDLRD